MENNLPQSKEPAHAGSLARIVRNILPVTIAALSWAGIGIAFIVLGTLLLAMLIPMSPLIVIALAWEFWRKPVAGWWGKQFEKGCKIIIPNDQMSGGVARPEPKGEI